MCHRSSLFRRTLLCSLMFSMTPLSFANAQWESSIANPPSLGNYRPVETNGRGSPYESGLDTAEAIYWSKNEFTIPFHVDASGKQPAEVQLEVSVDGGLSWSLYARDSLQSRQFRFASNQDGLYLFRIKTLDTTGQAYDAGGQPLKVFVDTQIPELNLTIDIDAQGRMVAEFQVVDANPRLESLRLEFQTEQNDRWTSIPFETQRSASDVVNGRGIWEVPATARQLVVRLIAKDAAGNEAEVTRLPLLPKTAMGQGGLQFASGAPSTRFGQSYTASPPASTTMGRPFASATPTPPPTPTPARSPFPQALPPSPTPTASMASTASRYALQAIADEKPSTSSPNDTGDVLYLHPNGTPSAGSATPSNSKDIALDYAIDREVQPLGTAQSIADKPFYSKSRAFSLDYEVEGQSTSPVASVELWGTIDGGKIWERWGTDPDGTSPFDIKVETDGLFGFRMVVVGANGLAGNRPINGDNADAWIQVDTDMPSARIVSALYGKGEDANALVIEYTAQDAYFGQRPITLSYSEIPAGPWTTIANGLKNTGRYVWPSDPTLPRRVYLKIEALDEAGNIGAHLLDVPVDIEGLAPRGRIQGFRPITP